MTGKTIYLLTGDIGGTNSRMGLYDVNSSIPLVVKYYRNQDYLKEKSDGIFEKFIIAPFLQHCWESNSNLAALTDAEIISCLAVAGPVRNNAVWMSNLHNLVIDGTAIAKHLYCPKDPYLNLIKVCKIINDFVAQGYGCLTLQPDEVRELNPNSHKRVDPTGPKVCVGAGTGLGQCFLAPDAQGVYSCFPSEGGHVEYAPRNDLEIKLWKYLKEKFGYKNRVSVERVVSGRGLANCYEFLSKEFPDKVDKKVHEEFLAAGDMQGAVVAINGKEGTLCRQAMEIMMRCVCGRKMWRTISSYCFLTNCAFCIYKFSAYGCEVGSSAVKFIPTGGMYVTGGLTPKNIKFIEGQKSPFMTSYHDKGRVSPILEHVPLFAVMVEDLGVRGAHKSAQLVRVEST
jgi:glucokinase